MPRSASVGGLAKRGVIPRKQFYNKMFVFNTVILGRGNWTFFGSDGGGRTAAVLRSFIASCKRSGIEPFAWFRDVLSRIPAHSITRLSELLPHNWQPATSPAQA